MKANFLFVLLAIVVFASSCQKQNVAPAGPLNITQHGPIVAKWNIAKDSTATQYSAQVYPHVYVGGADDYYDFRADGKCYIYENGAFDTLGYKIITNDRLVFTNSYYGAIINPLTSHGATISFIVAQGPGMGVYSKTVFLTK